MKLQGILLAMAGYGDRENVSEPVSEKFSDAIQTAASNGQVERLKELLAVSMDIRVHTLALQGAAENGHVECIRQLIPVSNPTDDDSLSLQWAAYNGHTNCIRLLLPVSDAKTARVKLVEDSWVGALAEDGRRYAVALLDSIIEEESLKAKHLKPTDERARAGL